MSEPEVLCATLECGFPVPEADTTCQRCRSLASHKSAPRRPEPRSRPGDFVNHQNSTVPLEPIYVPPEPEPDRPRPVFLNLKDRERRPCPLCKRRMGVLLAAGTGAFYWSCPSRLCAGTATIDQAAFRAWINAHPDRCNALLSPDSKIPRFLQGTGVSADPRAPVTYSDNCDENRKTRRHKLRRRRYGKK